MDENTVYLDNDGHANVRIDSSQPLTLQIAGVNGSITVRGDARSDVLISSDDYDDDDDEFPLVAIEARGNVITIKPNTAPPEAPVDLGGDPERVLRKATAWLARSARRQQSWPDFTVEIPRQMTCRLEAFTASGDIEIEDIAGTISVRSASGDLRITRAVGQLTVQSAGGDVSLEESVVAATVRTASGDLHINETVLVGIHAQTASGDCYLEGTLRGDHAARVETASGDVHLTLEQPDATGATLSFRTVAGSSNVDEPFRRVGRRRWQIGNGAGPQIEVATVSGDLNVDASFSSRLIDTRAVARYAEVATFPEPPESPAAPDAPAAPAAPASPAAPVAPTAPSSQEFTIHERLTVTPPEVDAPWFLESTFEEAEPAPARSPEEAARIALLEAVARGELDIEEALRRLDSPEAANA